MSDDILITAEIDDFVQNFEVTPLEDIGKKRWFRKSETLVKVYQVAALEATAEGGERVKEAVSRCGNVQLFIKELVTLSVWKEMVLPQLMKLRPVPEHSLPTYIVLYNEVALVGLLQALLYHSEMFRDVEECCIDIVDYCVRRLATINPDDLPVFNKLSMESDTLDDISRHHKKINFCVSTQSVCLLRYVCENLESLPLNVASRIYSTHDVPVLLTQLLDGETWTKRVEGKVYKFNVEEWKEWQPNDPALSKVECQVWLLIRQLLLNPSCDSVYYYSEYRKEQLSRLARHLHERVLDQLSPLADLKYWLHQLSISAPRGETVHNPLIMEVSKHYRDVLHAEHAGKWKEIAVNRSKLLFFADAKEIQFLASGFNGYVDNLEKMTETLHSCCNCFGKALKRCSRCKLTWYCSRNCQVEHWASHRNFCK